MKTTQRAVKYRGMSRFPIVGEADLFDVGINAMTRDTASAHGAQHPIVLISDRC